MESKKVKMTKEQAEVILRAMVPFSIEVEWCDDYISLIDINDNQAWVTIGNYGPYIGVPLDTQIPMSRVQDILRLADIASRIVCEEKGVTTKPMVNWKRVSRYHGTAWKYAARDKEGLWFLYTEEPKINDEMEAWIGGEVQVMDAAYFTGSDCDWRDSLVCRDDQLPF